MAKKRRPRERVIHRIRAEFLTVSDPADGNDWRRLHAFFEEGIRRGFVVCYSIRRHEKVESTFPAGTP